MDYKKIFRTRQSRSAMLKLLGFLPDGLMLRLQYRIKLGRKLNLRQPERFTEKLQWYKMHYRNPVMHTCVDKYAVREYVKGKGLEDTLVPLIARYDRVEDVDWAALPDQFVIKTSHGGGGLSVIVVPDKAVLDTAEAVEKLHFTGERVGSRHGGREWAYYGIPTGIVVEQLLINEENPAAGVNDYKILCYAGKPTYIVVDTDRYIGHKRNFYDTQWRNLNVTSDCPACDREIPRPENLDELLRVAARLSEDFPFMRVDLYDVGGKIYFGELTFYPWSGYVQYNPDEADLWFGKPFPLTEYRE